MEEPALLTAVLLFAPWTHCWNEDELGNTVRK